MSVHFCFRYVVTVTTSTIAGQIVIHISEGSGYGAVFELAATCDGGKSANDCSSCRSLRQALGAHVRPEQLEQFLSISADAEIDTKIEAKRREVEGLREIDSLRSRVGPERIEMPPLPGHLSNILNQTLETVSRDADRRVREHLAAHGMDGNQEWIARGIPHLRDDCPFCGQNIEGLELIEAYQAYFNEAYMKFRSELDRYSGLPGRYYSDDGVNLLAKKVASNRAIVELWDRYIAFQAPDDECLAALSDIILKFRKEMLAVLSKKSADPLVAVPLPESYVGAYAEMEQLAEAIKTYNAAVDAANGAIQKFKSSATPQRLQSAQNELRWLELTKLRHEDPIKTAADDFKRVSAEKDALDKVKEQAHDKLDKYSDEVVTRHLKAINDHLDNFNAGFRIAELKVEYTGREPNSTFCAVINSTTVDMGNSKTPIDQPSFKNTLSGGDRMTLALAFFLARVSDEPAKEKCIVVFDDPFNSQDRFRRTYTINQIIRCGVEVGQVIVLSHDNLFLREMWDKPLPKDERKALILTPCGVEDTLLLEWNIEEDTEGEDAGNKRVLATYYQGDGGNPRDVVKRIRPVVETFMTRVVPELAKHKSLGDKLAKVRSDNGPPALLHRFNLIDDINTFTRKYMHGEGQNPDAEHLSESELRGWVKRALELTGNL